MGFNSGPFDFIDESRIGKLTKEKSIVLASCNLGKMKNAQVSSNDFG